MDLFKLIETGNTNAIRGLLNKNSFNINEKLDGKSLLSIAIRNDQYDICQLLLENNIIVDSYGNNNITPFLLACQSGNVAIIELLHNYGANITIKTSGINGLWIASQNGHSQAVDKLIQLGLPYDSANTKDVSALEIACIKNKPGVVSILLSHYYFDKDKTIDLIFIKKLLKIIYDKNYINILKIFLNIIGNDNHLSILMRKFINDILKSNINSINTEFNDIVELSKVYIHNKNFLDFQLQALCLQKMMYHRMNLNVINPVIIHNVENYSAVTSNKFKLLHEIEQEGHKLMYP